jgi:hypothetical protein
MCLVSNGYIFLPVLFGQWLIDFDVTILKSSAGFKFFDSLLGNLLLVKIEVESSPEG